MKRKSIESIELEQVSVTFAGGRQILQDVSLKLPLGEVVWVRGKSGAGKSVLVKILSGLMSITSGRYLINNEAVNEMDFEDFKPYCLNMGYSFDYGGLINNRTIESNLLLPLDYHSAHTTSENRQAIENYLKIFGLTEVAQERPFSIVGGLRKAACVARAFVSEPQVLLLDDPTAGLRIGMIEKLKLLIQEKRQHGNLRHVFIATEDERMFSGLKPVVIEVGEKNLKIQSEKGVA